MDAAYVDPLKIIYCKNIENLMKKCNIINE